MTILSKDKQATDAAFIMRSKISLRMMGDTVDADKEAENQADLVEINKRLAKKPLQMSDVYMFDNIPSTNMIDSYFTRMTEQTLHNYEAQYNGESVPFQNSHKTDEQPIGRSYKGRMMSEGDFQGVMASTYMLRALNTTGINTDDLIRSIDAGISTDISVGFIAQDGYRCSVCGNDIRSMDCEHWLGEDDGKGGRVFAWVENGMLAESSLVYSGATPNAIVVKVRGLAKEGKISEKDYLDIDKLYGSRLAGEISNLVPKVHLFNQTNTKEVNDIMDISKLAEKLSLSEERKAQIDEIAKVEDADERAEKLASFINTLESENRTLAETNELYRSAETEEAHKAGVRAYGNDYKKDLYDKTFRSLTIQEIREFKEEFEARAKERLGGIDTELDADGNVIRETPTSEGGSHTEHADARTKSNAQDTVKVSDKDVQRMKNIL